MLNFILVNYPTLQRVELVKAQVDYPKSFDGYVIQVITPTGVIYDLCNYNYESIYKDSDDVDDINLKDCVSNIRLNIRVNIGIYKYAYGYYYGDYGVALNMLEVS